MDPDALILAVSFLTIAAVIFVYIIASTFGGDDE